MRRNLWLNVPSRLERICESLSQGLRGPLTYIKQEDIFADIVIATIKNVIIL